MSGTRAFVTIATAALLAGAATRDGSSAPAPAPAERLLSQLVGDWRMSGHVRGDAVAYRLSARRTLRGRFVELHMTDVARPPAYEARVLVGHDPATNRLVAHWMDSFGAAYSVPTATGEARGDTIELVFPYPDGAFRDRFVHDPVRDTWDFHLEAADSAGGWSTFARYAVRRAATAR